jgi:hypothetical protein
MKAVRDVQLLRPRQAALAQAEAHVVQHRQPGEQRVALEHHAAVGARAVDAAAVELHLAGRLRSSPATMRSSVLLPQPLGPRMVMKSFSATSRSVACSASVRVEAALDAAGTLLA